MDDEVPGDTSTLIYLAKADAFEEARAIIGDILVPPAVWWEAVDEGERIRAPDMVRIREAAEQGSLLRVELSSGERALAASIAVEQRLGLGESEVLALARRSGQAIVDEGRASRAARELGIVVTSTLFLSAFGRRSGALTSDGAIDFLRRLAVVTGARADAVFAIEHHLREELR